MSFSAADLIQMPESRWRELAKSMTPKPIDVWHSPEYLVTAYPEANGITRLSVNKTKTNGAGRWRDGIPWEDLQAIKCRVGFAHQDAVEVFPAQGDEVNVANMRHLWVMPERLSFAWRRPNA